MRSHTLRSTLSALMGLALLASPFVASAKTADAPASDEAKTADKDAPAPAKKKMAHKVGVQKKKTATPAE